MAWIRWLMMALLVNVFARCASGASGDWVPQDRKTFLNTLQAKDAQFDNLSIEFERRDAKMYSEFNEWIKASIRASEAGQKAPPRPDLAERPRKVDMVSVQRLTVRNGATTFDTRELTDDTGKSVDAGSSTKTSNATGVEQNLATVQGLKIFHDDTRPADQHGLLAEDRMLAEFCFGVGFGKRTLSIDKIDVDGSLALVDATMRLWSADVTKARLKIDKNFLVREAELLADSGGDDTRFEISTEGLIDCPKGAEIAKSGYLRRTALTAMVGGEKKTLNRSDANYSVSVVAISRNLDDATYSDLIRIDRSSATDVIRIDRPSATK